MTLGRPWIIRCHDVVLDSAVAFIVSPLLIQPTGWPFHFTIFKNATFGFQAQTNGSFADQPGQKPASELINSLRFGAATSLAEWLTAMSAPSRLTGRKWGTSSVAEKSFLFLGTAICLLTDQWHGVRSSALQHIEFSVDTWYI